MVLAGPAFNLLFPIFIYFVFGAGPERHAVPRPRLGKVIAGGSAADGRGCCPATGWSRGARPGKPAEPVRCFSDLPDGPPRAGERSDFASTGPAPGWSSRSTPAAEKESNLVETRPGA